MGLRTSGILRLRGLARVKGFAGFRCALSARHRLV